MNVLITGGGGQLGYCLQRRAPDSVTILAPSSSELDLSSPKKMQQWLADTKVDAVINAAAYTAVDQAESEPLLAELVNAEAVKVLASFCNEKGIPLLQVSTDFVFDGKQNHPYTPTDSTNPQNIYGKTKRLGEEYALQFASQSYVVRTGWIYCEHGQNFVKTMLRFASEREQLGIVADQIGTPTYADNLALMLWSLLDYMPEQRVFHFSDAGVASWYDLAQATFSLGLELGLISSEPELTPISTRDYPLPALRPVYSVLDESGTGRILNIPSEHWRVALARMLSRLDSQRVKAAT